MNRLTCRTLAAVALLVVGALPVAAQRVVPGWETPVPGALLSVVFEERVSAGEIASRTVPLFERFDRPAPRYGADVYRVVYWTSDHDGSPVRAHASLYMPVARPAMGADWRWPAVGAPVLAFGAGTSGLGNACAPSIEQPTIQRLGWYRENVLAYAGQGFIAIFPDYTGFNTSEIPQRYFSKYSEGYLMLDSLRAARAVASSPEVIARTRAVPLPQSFTAGYSQGGHAALAAADLLPSYAPEIDLVAAVGFGSTNSVETLFREAGFYPPSILYTYRLLYGAGRVRIEEILQPQWLVDLEFQVLTDCVFDFQLRYPHDVRGLFTPRFYDALMSRRLGDSFPEIKRILDENESGLSGHGLPVLMVQGNQDIIVTNAAQREFADRLRTAGSEVTLLEMEGVRHRDTRPAGFAASVDFMSRELARVLREQSGR